MLRLTFLLFTSATLSAGEFTFAEALRRAEAHSPALRAEMFAGRAAEARAEQAAVKPGPTLDLALENFAGTGAVRGAEGVEATVQVSQVIERGGKRSLRVALARDEQAQAEVDMAARRAEVRAAAASAFVTACAAQGRLAMSDAALSLAEEASVFAGQRAAAAEISGADAARARAALAMARAERLRAKAGLARAKAELAAFWGGEGGEVPVLKGTIPAAGEFARPGPELVFQKLSEHPRLAQISAAASGRRTALRLEQARAKADVTVGAGVRFLRDGSDAGLVAGVSVPMPFANPNAGNIRAAREMLAGAEESVRALEVELRVAGSAAWGEYGAALEIARTLRAEAWPATEEALAEVRAGYARGEASRFELFEMQRAHAALAREIFDADVAAVAAVARAEAITDPAFSFTRTLLSSP